MNRRQFVRGMLVSATATAAGGEALVRLASSEEVAQLAVQQPVIIGTPETQMFQNAWLASPEVYLRGPKGFFSVGVITRFEDKTMAMSRETWSGEAAIMPGSSGKIFFEGQS